MKKFLAKYFVATILPLIVCSCTLMLEEPPAPDATEPGESGDGITSPRTEINEFGKSTYQYNEGVRIIDESYLPYLVKAYKGSENDTILNETHLYFAKNIPADMVPQRGELISTQNVPMIDFALCDKVIAVETEGNFYKVTSHVVPLDKIFKVLEGEYILDIVADGDSASIGNTRSGQQSGGGAHFEGGYYRNLRTRASDEELLTSEKPMATVCVSSDGKTTPQDIFKELNTDSWGKPADISKKINHIKTEVSGSECQYFIGQQFYFTVAVKLSLTGIRVDLTSKVKTALGIDGKKFKGATSMGVFCTDGSDVESDGFFPANSFNKYEYILELPDVLSIPIVIGVPMTITVGCSVINDMKFELDSSEKFHFETSFTDENFKFGATDKESKVKKKKGGVKHQTNEHDGTVKFKYGTRNTFEINVGFSLGAGGSTVEKVKNVMAATTLKGILKESAKEIAGDQLPSFTPLVIRLVFTYKDVNFSDNSAVSPSTIEYNGRTYKCGGNSWRDRSLSLGAGARFLQISGLGSVTGEIADATMDQYGNKDIQTFYNILGKLRSILSTPTAGGEIWSAHSSKYATFQYDIDVDVDEGLEDFEYDDKLIYEVELTPNVVDETHETDHFYANRCFSNLQLLVLDKNNKVIAVGEPSGSAPGFANKIIPEEKAYQDIYPKEDYEFKFALNKRYAIEGIKLVPAYVEWYNPQNPSSQFGWTKTYMYDIPYTIYGENTAVKFNYPKGRRILNKPNFVGVLFDADFLLSEKDNKRRADQKMWVEVQGLNDKGEVIMKGTLCFDGQSKRAGTLKGLAYFPADELDSVKKITFIAKYSYLTYGIKNLQEIGRQTFDFPLVPNGESNAIDSKEYQKDGYATGTVY